MSSERQVAQAINNHQAEINVLRFLVLAMYDYCTDRSAVLNRLRGSIEAAAAKMLPDTDPETIVELRNHSEFYYTELFAMLNKNRRS